MLAADDGSSSQGMCHLDLIRDFSKLSGMRDGKASQL